MTDVPKLDLLIIVIIAVIFVILATNEQSRFDLLKKDFSNRLFVTSFILIFIVTISCLRYGNKKLKYACRSALISFIIAYLAHLNMAFAVYFIVGILVYYNGNSIY